MTTPKAVRPSPSPAVTALPEGAPRGGCPARASLPLPPGEVAERSEDGEAADNDRTNGGKTSPSPAVTALPEGAPRGGSPVRASSLPLPLGEVAERCEVGEGADNDRTNDGKPLSTSCGDRSPGGSARGRARITKKRLSLFGRGADSFFSADLLGAGAVGKYETRSPPLGERAYRIYPIFRARVPSGNTKRAPPLGERAYRVLSDLLGADAVGKYETRSPLGERAHRVLSDLPGAGAVGKYETRSPRGERAYRIYPIFRARVPSGVSMRLMFAPRARSLPMMSS